MLEIETLERKSKQKTKIVVFAETWLCLTWIFALIFFSCGIKWIRIAKDLKIAKKFFSIIRYTPLTTLSSSTFSFLPLVSGIDVVVVVDADVVVVVYQNYISIAFVNFCIVCYSQFREIIIDELISFFFSLLFFILNIFLLLSLKSILKIAWLMSNKSKTMTKNKFTRKQERKKERKANHKLQIIVKLSNWLIIQQQHQLKETKNTLL